ncbi:MAG: hypothetical protein KAH01_04940 [Caldisericia bacterium]|nr:hypothetical protein [Caldisericia bacterium]
MLPIKSFDSFNNGVFFDVWKPQREVIVLGRFSSNSDIHKNASDKISIVRRIGGGGTVLLNENSLVIDVGIYKKPGFTVKDYFYMFNDIVLKTIKKQCINAKYDPFSFDFIYGNRKFGGVTLAIRKNLVLYGLSLILNQSLVNHIQEYLAIPSKQPTYRKKRDHDVFLIPLSNIPYFNESSCISDLKHSLQQFIFNEENNEIQNNKRMQYEQ